MNTDTGQIYRTTDEIAAAQERQERLIFGTEGELAEMQPLLLNRAQRRLLARQQRRRDKRG